MIYDLVFLSISIPSTNLIENTSDYLFHEREAIHVFPVSCDFDFESYYQAVLEISAAFWRAPEPLSSLERSRIDPTAESTLHTR